MFFARSSDDPSNGMAPPKTTTFQFYGQVTHETDYSGDIKLLDEIRNTGSNTAISAYSNFKASSKTVVSIKL